MKYIIYLKENKMPNIPCGGLPIFYCPEMGCSTVEAVERTKKIYDDNEQFILISYHPDVIYFLRYYAENIKGLDNIEFFIDQRSLGTNIEPIFNEINKSISSTGQYTLQRRKEKN